MSKQQGIDVPEVQERNTGMHKKRNGKFELWMKCGEETTIFSKNWIKVRSYETKELAEKNMKDNIRKWNCTSKIKWLFEIREKQDTKH